MWQHMSGMPALRTEWSCELYELFVGSFIFMPVPDDGFMKKPKHRAHIFIIRTLSEKMYLFTFPLFIRLNYQGQCRRLGG